MRNLITNLRKIHMEIFWNWSKILALSSVLCSTSQPFCSSMHAQLFLGHLSQAAASARSILLQHPLSDGELSCSSWSTAGPEGQVSTVPCCCSSSREQDGIDPSSCSIFPSVLLVLWRLWASATSQLWVLQGRKQKHFA